MTLSCGRRCVGCRFKALSLLFSFGPSYWRRPDAISNQMQLRTKDTQLFQAQEVIKKLQKEMKKQVKEAVRAKRGAAKTQKKLVDANWNLEAAESDAFESVESLAQELEAQAASKDSTIAGLQTKADTLRSALDQRDTELAQVRLKAEELEKLLLSVQAENESLMVRIEAVADAEARLAEADKMVEASRAAADEKEKELLATRAEGEILMGKMEEMKKRLAAYMDETVQSCGEGAADDSVATLPTEMKLQENMEELERKLTEANRSKDELQEKMERLEVKSPFPLNRPHSAAQMDLGMHCLG